MSDNNFFDNFKDSFDALVSEKNIEQSIENRDFIYAVRRGKAEHVLEMLQNGQDSNIFNLAQRTVMLVAISKKNEEIVEILLKYGADPYKPANDTYKTTSIDIIVMRGMTTMLKLLRKYRVDFNKLDNKGETALYKAVAENKPEIVECLLRWGCDPLLTGNEKMTPVALAFKRGRQDILAQFMQHKDVLKNINTPEKLGMSSGHVLPQIIEYGVSETVPLLLEQGVNINVYDEEGQTPSHKIVENGDVNNIALLIEHGVDLNTMPRHEDGYLPLHVACDVWRWQENRTPDMLRVLLFGGADPNIIETKRRTTPLTILLKNDNIMNLPDCVDILLEFDAATNVYDKDGKTPLLYALDLNHSKDYRIVEDLLKAGANPNLPEKTTGKTPFHYIVSKGDKETIELFISYGANPLLKDKAGKTAFDLVNKEYLPLLKQAVENQNKVKRSGNNRGGFKL